MNSEDLELEMANYINDMAQTLIKANMTLPTGTHTINIHCTTLQCTALHCTAPHCTTLHFYY